MRVLTEIDRIHDRGSMFLPRFRLSIIDMDLSLALLSQKMGGAAATAVIEKAADQEIEVNCTILTTNLLIGNGNH